MATRPAHYNTRYKHDLTPRQREVLELIARGRTNAEIGERLGLSLDGAKWHVREILSKLNLDSREQAADYWRNYQRPLTRLARTFAAISMPGALKVGLAGGAALGVAGIAVAAVIALRGGGDGGGTVSVAPGGSPASTSEDRQATAPAADCDILNWYGNAVSDRGGTVRVLIEASAPGPCAFRGDLAVTISDAASLPADISGNPKSVAVNAELGQTPTVVAVGVWGNWCGTRGGFVLGVTLPGGESLYSLDVPTPACDGASVPSSFVAAQVLYGLFRPFGSPQPVTTGLAFAEIFADSLAEQIAAGQVGVFLAGY